MNHDFPNLKDLIASLECDNWSTGVYQCKKCPYNYQYFNDSGDYGYWTCNENKQIEDALFYLKLYQYLIDEEQKNV